VRVDSQQAFELLRAEVNLAVKESLARHATATQQGDLDAMEVELERQRNLVNVRNQLQVLQDLWPTLVGKRKPHTAKPPRKRRPRRKKLKRGQKTPGEAFVIPILQALEEMGGNGRVPTVLDQVGQSMAGCLNEHDLAKLKSGQVRWRNTAQWARLDMKKQGLLASNSPRGTWEVTDQGRAYLAEHRDETAAPPTPAATQPQLPLLPDEGLPIFAKYKGRRYEATLLRDRRVRYGGREYKSPSGAGVTIVPYDTLNGWKFWRYVDEDGTEHYISDLRD
jgi:hypothetical protein